MKNSLKNKLKFDYENLHEAPSVGLWERLENELEDKKAISKKSFGWVKYAAVILLLISFSVFFFINKNTVSIEKPFTEQVQKKQDNIEKNIQEKKSVNIEIYGLENVIHKKKLAKSLPEKHENSIEEKQIIENKQTNFVENKTSKISEEKEDIILPKPQEKKEVLVQNKTEKTNTKYVNADDLLFGRELEKASLEQENTKSKMGSLDLKLKRPKTIEILGFTVYSEEK